MQTLIGKRVLITGGGGGLGRALAARFAAAGARIVVTDRDAAAAAAVAGDVKGATALQLDVTDPADIQTAREQILAAGPIDVLVNNAGVVHGGPFATVPLDRHQQTLAVNLDGVVAVIHAFLPELLARPEAYLVNIASAAAFIPLPHAAVYAATKWAVLGLSESLREELRLLGHRRIGVTAVCPSYIDTGLFAGAKPPKLTPWLTADAVAAATVRAVLRCRPLVLLPRAVRIQMAVAGLLPWPLWRRVIAWMGVSTSMTEWRGRGESES